MYCKPDDGAAFSYGAVIDNVVFEGGEGDKTGTFTGRSRKEGKYEIENGTLTYDDYQRVHIAYEEVWPNGTRDALTAMLKSNAKYSCESTGGYEQKATNESLNLPEDPEARIGDGAMDGVKKYYLRDKDAAVDGGEE